jgi:hypothetical protein
VLYLGAASGTTVSHVSDIVGPVSSLSPKSVAGSCLCLICYLKNLDTVSGWFGLRC